MHPATRPLPKPPATPRYCPARERLIRSGVLRPGRDLGPDLPVPTLRLDDAGVRAAAQHMTEWEAHRARTPWDTAMPAEAPKGDRGERPRARGWIS